jgi:hypothetical protein
MKDFIKEIVQDMKLVVPKLECEIGESKDTFTVSSSVANSPIENGFYTKDGDTESLIKTIVSDLCELISDTEPYGIVIEPKIDCEFKVSDPFFDSLDDCSGGFYPSYRMKDCAKMVARVTNLLAFVGQMNIEKSNNKDGVFVRLHNRDSDIRLSLRVGRIENAPILILRFGDYRNFDIVTQVIDGSIVEGKMNFMAIEFVSAIIPMMIKLCVQLSVNRHKIRVQSEKIVEQMFRELGWKQKTKKEPE